MTHQAQNACILLAAGASKRMGVDKLSLPFGNTTILGASANALRGAAFWKKIVVLGANLPPHLEGFQVATVAEHTPMHGSLRAGVKLLDPESEYFCVALGDQPLLTSLHINQLLDIWPLAHSAGKDLVVPVSARGDRGNPCLIHRRYIPEILAHADDDRGCFYLFQKHRDQVLEWKTEEKAFFTDIDTKEDYECVTLSS